MRTVVGAAWQQSKGIDVNRLRIKHAEDVQRRRGALISDDLLDYIVYIVGCAG